MDNRNKVLADQSSLQGLKVLMAEDDLINIAIIQKVLSRWNIQTSVAENGLVAVEMARNGTFDVILMDVQMPVMDGLAASREIRKFNPQIPIVVVTSLTLYDIRENFNKINITEFVFKPLNLEYLFQVLLKYAVNKNKDTKSDYSLEDAISL